MVAWQQKAFNVQSLDHRKTANNGRLQQKAVNCQSLYHRKTINNGRLAPESCQLPATLSQKNCQ
jgi:hypothetical protein